MKKTASILLLCSMLTACVGGVPNSMRPANRLFEHMPENGSDEYKQGWTEGCESGMSGMTNSFYQSFYVFKQDNQLLTNEVYYKAWKDSYDYCKGYVYGIMKEANIKRSLPNARKQFLPGGGGGTNILGNPKSGKTSSHGALGWMGSLGPTGLFRW